MASFVLLGLGALIDLYSASLLLLAVKERRARTGIMLVPLILYGIFLAVRAHMAAPLMLALVLALGAVHVVLQVAFMAVNRWLGSQGHG